MISLLTLMDFSDRQRTEKEWEIIGTPISGRNVSGHGFSPGKCLSSFFRKAQKLNQNKSIQLFCEETLQGEFSVPFLVPSVFSRIQTVLDYRVCDRSNRTRLHAHAIA